MQSDGIPYRPMTFRPIWLSDYKWFHPRPGYILDPLLFPVENHTTHPSTNWFLWILPVPKFIFCKLQSCGLNDWCILKERPTNFVYQSQSYSVSVALWIPTKPFTFFYKIFKRFCWSALRISPVVFKKWRHRNWQDFDQKLAGSFMPVDIKKVSFTEFFNSGHTLQDRLMMKTHCFSKQ